MNEQDDKNDNTLKAKNVSLLAQVAGALWIVGWTSYKFIKNEPDIDDVVKSGVVIAACFSPVYLNIFMDKITKIFTGDKS